MAFTALTAAGLAGVVAAPLAFSVGVASGHITANVIGSMVRPERSSGPGL